MWQCIFSSEKILLSCLSGSRSNNDRDTKEQATCVIPYLSCIAIRVAIGMRETTSCPLRDGDITRQPTRVLTVPAPMSCNARPYASHVDCVRQTQVRMRSVASLLTSRVWPLLVVSMRIVLTPRVLIEVCAMKHGVKPDNCCTNPVSTGGEKAKLNDHLGDI
jgi:hypothetical protein